VILGLLALPSLSPASCPVLNPRAEALPGIILAHDSRFPERQAISRPAYVPAAPSTPAPCGPSDKGKTD